MNRNESGFYEYLAELDTKTFSSSQKDIDRTYRAVLKKAGLKRRTPAPKKLGRIFLIAAAAVACTAVTAAAAGFNIGEMFRGYFEHDARNAPGIPASAASLSQSQIAVIDKSGKPIEQSITDNGMTVILKAAVCDQSNIYILLDVSAPEGTVLARDDYSFKIKRCQLVMNDAHGSCSVGRKLRLLKDDDPQDNQKSFVLEMGYSGVDVRGKTFRLELSDFSTLRQEKAEDYFTPVVKGNWAFDPITLQSDTATKELKVDQVTHFNKNAPVDSNAHEDVRSENTEQCTVDSISLSSFSAIVHFTGKEVKTKGDTFAVPSSLTLNLKDGTKAESPFRSGGSCTGAKAYYVWRFDEPVDVGAVSSVTLGDLTVPVS